MNPPLRLLFLGALVFSFTRASNNTYIHPSRGADFDQCKDSILKNATIPSNPNFTPVFVDAFGYIVPRNQTCGVDYPCGVDYRTCVNYCGSSSTPATWSTFSPQFSAWFLPFFAFVAQLPFPTLTTWDYIMSVLLMMGSPALAAYSLILSLFGNRWLRKHCAGAADLMPGRTENERAMKNNLKIIFDSMKNVLYLAQQEPFENLHFGSQPVDIDAETKWWKKLNMIVQVTKRRFNASFVHQVLWVNAAIGLAVVDAFGSEKIGNNVTAFGLAISLVWQWETPVVVGWVLVGVSGVGTAILSAILETSDEFGFFNIYDPTALRDNSTGDRAQPGPIFNYARVFIWTQRAERFINRYQPYIYPRPPPLDNFRSTSFKHITYSVVLALALQWSVSGASILLSYLTPTVGLSCRSGGYLIYTVNSTIILFLLIVCSCLSDIRRVLKPQEHWTQIYGRIAVVLRTLAKTIAVLNAVWISLHCIFEFTGFYDNCWCNSNYAVLGQRGYWIWLSDAQLRELWDIREIWGGCTSLAIIVPSLFVLLFIATHDNDKLSEDLREELSVVPETEADQSHK